jgi:hypothetical protein
MNAEPPSSPWLSPVDLATYIRCLKADGTPSPDGARMWARRHGVVPAHRGRRLLYARADVDAALTGALHTVYGRTKRRAS